MVHHVHDVAVVYNSAQVLNVLNLGALLAHQVSLSFLLLGLFPSSLLGVVLSAFIKSLVGGKLLLLLHELLFIAVVLWLSGRDLELLLSIAVLLELLGSIVTP